MVASIALELYSVREYTEKDFAGTVRKIAAMGYAGVETADFPGTTAKAAGALFKELGLQVPSAHVSEFFSKDQTKKLEEMDIIGCKRLICPGISAKLFESMDGLKQAADMLNDGNRICNNHGLAFGYHNHYKEFYLVDGRTAYEILIDMVDPNILFQLDTYWAQVAGVDVPALVRKLGKRATLLHLKDGPGKKGKPMLALGDGIMDFPAILTAAKDVCEWEIVEIDSCATDMLEAVNKSYQYLAGFKI